jgi:FkbM family methyltransferase
MVSAGRRLFSVAVRGRKLGAGVPGAVWIVLVSFAMLCKARIAPRLSLPIVLRSGQVIWLRDRAQLWNLDEVYLDLEYAHFRAEPEVLLDLGANIGVSATWLAVRYPGVPIIAVEPDPDNVALLRRNTANYPQIRVIEGAIAARGGTIGLKRGGHSWGTRVSEEGDVPAYALADLLNGVNGPVVVKMDIEGSEWAVLPTVSEQIIEVYGEWHAEPGVGDPAAKLARIAASVGMRSIPAEAERFHWCRPA